MTLRAGTALLLTPRTRSSSSNLQGAALPARREASRAALSEHRAEDPAAGSDRDVPDISSVPEGNSWSAVDREASAATPCHLADEAEHAEAPGARGGERVLDQPAVHERGAGARARRRPERAHLDEHQRGETGQIPPAQIRHRAPGPPQRHQNLEQLERF
ncbi:hypothetical protein MHYP_G00130590 [Metynnis hypsauchen]